MDITKKIEELVSTISSNKSLLSQFNVNPTSVVQKLVGGNLSLDTIKTLVEGIKAKISLDDVKKIADTDGDGKLTINDAKKLLDADGDGKIELDDAKAALGKLKGLFGKK